MTRNHGATVTYTVTGVGRFPVDMLRYDRCWPRSEQDASAVIDSYHRAPHGESTAHRTVEIEGVKAPTTERWASFRWTVLDA